MRSMEQSVNKRSVEVEELHEQSFLTYKHSYHKVVLEADGSNNKLDGKKNKRRGVKFGEQETAVEND
ncbi:hypothetical protein MSG28_004382 [Choristoneura fumiferana]|uniref:Uncharacterized protein n=1 Tax=Choristoneura fumiferana TaxID=7141 RepID=A0ACC0KIV5_CHOFU|nr:hypothetical protein MSG28_004382 [Choristoneura fumiferana]